MPDELKTTNDDLESPIIHNRHILDFLEWQLTPLIGPSEFLKDKVYLKLGCGQKLAAWRRRERWAKRFHSIARRLAIAKLEESAKSALIHM